MPQKQPPLSHKAVKKLVRWYHQNKREMPWRGTRDAYKIWVSEIMLQQTQVETVKPYFKRFIKAFPTVDKLAKADLDKVLKVWEGCGYYARAKNLHRSAQKIATSGGKLPQTAEELRKLHGIGPYTSAAIASIAYDEPVPVLDGNVERVLSRLLCEKGLLKSNATQKKLRAVAGKIMQSAVAQKILPGDINQALMELGATVCKPKNPKCGICALNTECLGFQRLKDISVLPKKEKSKPLPHYDIGAAIIRKNGKILITQRPLEGLLGGLWEFPGGKKHPDESLEECVAREIKEELDIEIEVGKLFAQVNHSYTHLKITLHCFDCKPKRGRIKKIGIQNFKWITPAEFSDYTFPKADRVIISALQSY